MHWLIPYISHQWNSKSKHGIHSPFVYDFVTKVLPHRPTPFGDQVERLRKRLRARRQMLEISDLGAGYGGRERPVIHKTLREVLHSSARNRREGELLTRMVNRYAPGQVLELGTNVGFSAMYLLGGGEPKPELISIEGSEVLSRIASENLQALGCSACLLVGDFAAVLGEDVEWRRFRPSLVLMDGNHRKQATLDYFHTLLPRLGKDPVVVIDDIHWSAEMWQAWNEIIRHERISVSLDLYSLGICFLDRPQAKEHFRLKIWPW
ncbi:MAG: hypothetical protein RLZZ165_1239 [Bacteroidota bacterium]|jgi:predicted O-methyltransferase YrrM